MVATIGRRTMPVLVVVAVMLLESVVRADAPSLNECAAGRLRCRNGGTVVPALCQDYVSPNNVLPVECDCPPEFQGINCHIPMSTAGCPDGYYFDGNPLTNKTRQVFECSVDQRVDRAARRWFSWALPQNRTLADDIVALAGHSVHVTTDWSRKEIEISILSRTPYRFARNLWMMRLGPVDEVVRCTGKGCVLDGNTAQCASFSCSTMHKDFPLFNQVLTSMHSAAIRIDAGTIDVAGFLQFNACKYGTCVPIHAPGSSAAAGAALGPLFASFLMVVLVGVVFVMHRETLRPPAAILGKKSRYGVKRKATKFAIPVGLAWRNVTYTLPSKRSLLHMTSTPGDTILKNSSGIVRPGEMVAIIGPSGAGKSTLLNLLGGLNQKGTLVGDISLTGACSGNYPKSHLLSHVVQSDHFLGIMTVWETLYFNAVTRLPRVLPETEILERVAETLDLVGLRHVATSVVGTPESGGISGGERRRLAVGVELIAEPRVMLLDEVTSGLDSYYASSILNVLRNVATKTGVAIVLTIHQPPAATFALFDRIVLMATGGLTVFQGSPNEALAFAHSNRLAASPCEEGSNPFEYLISALSSSAVDDASDAFRKSAEFQTISSEIASQIDKEESDGRNKYEPLQGAVQQRKRLNFFQQTSVLTMRSFRVIARDPSLLILYNFLTLGVALFAGFTFMNMDLSVSGIQNRSGYVFCAILIGALLSMTSIDSFVIDRILFEKETRAGCYGVLPYFLAKLSVDLIPFRIIPALIFTCITYYWVGFQRDFMHFAVFTSVLVLSNAVAGASIFAISTAFADVKSANLIGITYFMFNIVFGGPLLSQAQRESSSAALSYCSFFYYAFETMVSHEMVGLPFFLKMSDLLQDKRFGNSGKDATGEEMLRTMSWNPDNRLLNVYVLCGMLGGLYLIALIFLKMSQRNKR